LRPFQGLSKDPFERVKSHEGPVLEEGSSQGEQAET
jgi:hypothetical protein